MEAYRLKYDEPGAAATLSAKLAALLPQPLFDRNGHLVFLCIGTDRSTGDALGPLVGMRLAAQGLPVYGTLDEPVHASNLCETLVRLEEKHADAFLVAVDACLGRSESVGLLAVAPGPLLPGAGVNKNLPAVGQVHITGTVNVGGFMEHFVLQNTRLSLVVRMADVIAEGLERLAAELADTPGMAHRATW